MKQTFYNAFGYCIRKDSYDRGEVADVHVRTPFNRNVTKDTMDVYSEHNIYLHTVGRVAVLHNDTGSVFYQDPGWCTLENTNMLGKYTATMMTDVEIFLILYRNNTEMVPIVPDVEIIRAPSGTTIPFTSGQKVFLAAGTFNAGGTTVTGPKQIQFSSDKEVSVVENCYGFIFK